MKLIMIIIVVAMLIALGWLIPVIAAVIIIWIIYSVVFRFN